MIPAAGPHARPGIAETSKGGNDMKQHRIARTGQMAAVLGLVLGMGLLAACRSHAPAADRPADTTAVQFPEASKASLKEGIYPDVADLRRFAPGMSKRQLYTLLGTPHFNEGMWGVREWNYLFNFRTAQGAEYFTCQFQVRFDSKGIAQGGGATGSRNRARR